MTSGKVLSFEHAGEGYTSWHILKLEGIDDEYLVHQNWVNGVPNGNPAIKERLEKTEWIARPNDELKPGEEVEFDEAFPTYSNDPHKFLKNLHRVAKQGEVVL